MLEGEADATSWIFNIRKRFSRVRFQQDVVLLQEGGFIQVRFSRMRFSRVRFSRMWFCSSSKERVQLQ